jgi:hypothetical protein
MTLEKKITTEQDKEQEMGEHDKTGGISIGGNATGSSLIIGSGNTVNIVNKHTTTNSGPAAEIDELRKLLGELKGAMAGRAQQSLQNAAEEVSKPKPDKSLIATDMEHALDYAKKAENFSEIVEKIVPRVTALAKWLGDAGAKLLPLLG